MAHFSLFREFAIQLKNTPFLAKMGTSMDVRVGLDGGDGGGAGGVLLEFMKDTPYFDPRGWALGCLLYMIWRKLIYYNRIALYICITWLDTGVYTHNNKWNIFYSENDFKLYICEQ